LVISPRETLSMGFRVLVSLHPAIQATGRLTLAPAGLPPAEHTSLHWTHNWSLIFWINIPLGFLAFLASREALKRLPRHERPHKLDILGSLLMVAAAIALLLALTSGGTRFPWSSVPILGLFALSASLWVVFATRLLWAPEPFLPLSILANQV